MTEPAPTSALIDGRELALPKGASGREALTVARVCGVTAGEILRRNFRSVEGRRVEFKGERNPVTATDVAVEEATVAILQREFPGHAILGEERGGEPAEGWLWVIDPLDGTRNFASGAPHFAFNLALCYDQRPVLGVTVDPLRNEEFLGVWGRGATVNGRPLRVGQHATLAEGVVSTGMGYDNAAGKPLLALLHELWPGMQTIRISGSAALDLAYIAAGRFDLFVHFGLYAWDLAAGVVLIEEAGGTITDGEGKPVTLMSKRVVAGNSLVHGDFVRRASGEVGGPQA